MPAIAALVAPLNQIAKSSGNMFAGAVVNTARSNFRSGSLRLSALVLD